MPDLKTALETALKEWGDDSNQPKEKKMAPQIFKPTNNVTRETFNYIKQNKGCTKREVRDALMARGFKEHSITSLLAQMLRQNYLAIDDAGKLRNKIDEYKPLKAFKSKKADAGKVVKVVNLKEKLAQPPEPVPVLKIKHIQSDSWTAEEILNKLNVVEAKALYKELTRVFEE